MIIHCNIVIVKPFSWLADEKSFAKVYFQIHLPPTKEAFLVLIVIKKPPCDNKGALVFVIKPMT